jgi:hypothetical protein
MDSHSWTSKTYSYGVEPIPKGRRRVMFRQLGERRGLEPGNVDFIIISLGIEISSASRNI